ncbi:Flp pilus assembly protein CpaB [Lacrimispora algidixylanolytica]|uniref:Flp pilus assembly protein CpaB n=1 Tax=Lacrimispora algidixylanolytica TaxID=94868 RepID=A0A419T4M6_9FIRM|nr:Flp pilus assembly protein CpaB [Lacrimispora algidixylanolytica]RKD32396.1 Flp pilus assembly protein CpaB [Lacrimispora algidixylanolytica]
MRFLKNRTVLGIICIMLALLICFGITPLYNQSISQKATIVRVVKEIGSGEEITKDMVQSVEVGSYNLPEQVVRQMDSAIGKYAVTALSPGDYILASKLTAVPAEENNYLYDLDGNKQAISVSIKNFAQGLSGKLASGDIVSVIASDYKKQGATVIPPELTYIKVIGVTASSGYDTDQNNTESNQLAEKEKKLPASVTLLASPDQAKILAELESEGNIHLSLAYRGSKENADKFLDIQSKLLEALYPSPSQNSTSQADSTVPEDGSSGDTSSNDSSETDTYANSVVELESGGMND